MKNVLILAIGLVTFAIYLPTLQFDFVNWDDDLLIINNISIRYLNFSQTSNYFTEFVHGLYHPLTSLSYAIDYYIAGLNPHQYHLTNVVFHVLNTFLVFNFIYKLCGNHYKYTLLISSIVSFLFGIHPMHVESVAWATERKDVLCTTFFLLSLIAYTNYIFKKRLKFYLLALFFALLALFAKAQAVSLFLVFVLIDFLYQRRLNDKYVLFEKLPILFLSIVFGLANVWAQSLNSNLSTKSSYDLFERLILSNYSLNQYLTKLIVPLNLSVYYPYPARINEPIVFQYGLYIFTSIMVICATIYSLKYSRFIVFGLLFFLSNIIFNLQIIPNTITIIADRYSYISYIGLFLLIGITIHVALVNYPSKRIGIYLFVSIYLVFITITTWQRIPIWRNSITLWTDVLEKYPKLEIAKTRLNLARIDNMIKVKGNYHNSSKLSFKSNLLKIGVIKNKLYKKKFTFYFVNEGADTLQILDTYTKVSWIKVTTTARVPPNQTGQLDVTIYPKNKVGLISEEIKVFTNSKDFVVTIPITGHVQHL